MRHEVGSVNERDASCFIYTRVLCCGAYLARNEREAYAPPPACTANLHVDRVPHPAKESTRSPLHRSHRVDSLATSRTQCIQTTTRWASDKFPLSKIVSSKKVFTYAPDDTLLSSLSLCLAIHVHAPEPDTSLLPPAALVTTDRDDRRLLFLCTRRPRRSSKCALPR